MPSEPETVAAFDENELIVKIYSGRAVRKIHPVKQLPLKMDEPTHRFARIADAHHRVSALVEYGD